MASMFVIGMVQEVCFFESFTARCPYNKVISMSSASYGKIETRRCTTAVDGDSSCQSDVLGQADRMCSGQRQCEIPIPNPDFEAAKPCLETVRSYFAGLYECIEGNI